MNILNVSFGIYAFMPQGWLFMAAIIIIECLVLSYFLTETWKDSKAYKAAILSNIISGVFGIIASLIINGGWWLVVWFPWVSMHEVNGMEARNMLGFFYLAAFVVTVIIESGTNYLFLKKSFEKKQIFKMTLRTNVISYLVGSIAMYSYSM